MPRGSARHRIAPLAAAVVAAALLSPSLAAGQRTGSGVPGIGVPSCADARWDAEGPTVRGTVVDAASERPLAGARVTIVALDAHAQLHATRACTALTAGDGAYRVESLAPGEYRLTTGAAGYAPRELRVRVERGASTELHVLLERLPTTLAPVVVTTALPAPREPASLDADTLAPEVRERRRQARWLASDARAIAASRLMDHAAFGEPDVLRALRVQPGTSTRDAWTVLPWSRGAAGDQTAITLDGLPLFNAVHAVGAVSALLPEMLDDVVVLPSMAPADVAGGATAVRLATRPAAATGAPVRGAATWSSIAASARAEAHALDGKARVLVAGRRSTVDTPLRGGALPWRGRRLPYAFGDLALRADVGAVHGWRMRASGFASFDALRGEIPRVASGGTGQWTAHGGRLELSRTLGDGELTQGVGASRMRSALRTTMTQPSLDVVGTLDGGSVLAPQGGGWQAQPIDGAVRYADASLGWRSRPDADGASRTAVGVQLVSLDARFAIRGLWPRSTSVDDSVRVDTRLSMLAVWAERRWECDCVRPLTLSAGGRVEAGERPRNAGPVRVAPRAAARWQLTPATALVATGWSSYQYTQAIAPSGPGQNLVAITNALWVTAGRDVPVLWSRGATVGGERWLGSHALLSATAWWRGGVGALVPDPRAGNLIDRPLATQATTDARGVEASVRRLSGRLTGGLSLGAGTGHVTAEGIRYAAPTQRPWVARADAEAELWQGPRTGRWRVGTMLEHAAGASYTRYTEGLLRCESTADCTWLRAPRLGAASAGRGPGGARLDVSLRGSRPVAGRTVDVLAQVEDLGALAPAGAYLGTVGRCPANGAAPCDPHLAPAAFEDVRLPAAGPRLGLALRIGL